MAISSADFCSFIIELVMRNPTMCIPALEDDLFVNLLICDYLCMYTQGPCMSQYKPLFGESVTTGRVEVGGG